MRSTPWGHDCKRREQLLGAQNYRPMPFDRLWHEHDRACTMRMVQDERGAYFVPGSMVPTPMPFVMGPVTPMPYPEIRSKILGISYGSTDQ